MSDFSYIITKLYNDIINKLKFNTKGAGRNIDIYPIISDASDVLDNIDYSAENEENILKIKELINNLINELKSIDKQK